MFENLLLTLFLAFLFIFFIEKFDKYLSRKIIYYYKYFIYFFLIFLSSHVFLPVFIFHPKNVHNGSLFSRYMKHVSKIIGIEYHIFNSGVLNGINGAVIIANHKSILDGLAIVNTWEAAGKMKVIIKKEVLWMGTPALTAYLAGTIFIDRKNTKSAYNTLKSTTEMLSKQKTKIWIYPEGTRNQSEHIKLLPFKKGAFNIAVTAQVPIIPVVMSPYYFIDSKKRSFNKGHILMEYLEPVSTVGLTLEDVPELTEKLHGIMLAAYEKLSAKVINNYC